MRVLIIRLPKFLAKIVTLFGGRKYSSPTRHRLYKLCVRSVCRWNCPLKIKLRPVTGKRRI